MSEESEILEGRFLEVAIPVEFWLSISVDRMCELLEGAPFEDAETALVLRLAGRLN